MLVTDRTDNVHISVSIKENYLVRGQTINYGDIFAIVRCKVCDSRTTIEKRVLLRDNDNALSRTILSPVRSTQMNREMKEAAARFFAEKLFFKGKRSLCVDGTNALKISQMIFTIFFRFHLYRRWKTIMVMRTVNNSASKPLP